LGRGLIFLSGNKLLYGFLDQLREHLEILDESITTARKLAKPKRGVSSRDAIQALKILRALIEERNLVLDRIKAHLNGRDETGAIREPESEVEFERTFRNMLRLWRVEDLRLECEECGRVSERVSSRTVRVGFDPLGGEQTEDQDLCDPCFRKLERDFDKAQAEAAARTEGSS
jgi:Cdc6-like AAA superfamily ATPase